MIGAGVPNQERDKPTTGSGLLDEGVITKDTAKSVLVNYSR